MWKKIRTVLVVKKIDRVIAQNIQRKMISLQIYIMLEVNSLIYDKMSYNIRFTFT